MKFLFSLILFLPLLFIVSCGGENQSKSRSLVPAKFNSPSNNSMVRIGENLHINVTASSLKDIKNIKISTKDTVIYDGMPTDENLKFNLNIDNWGIGSIQLNLETTLKDDRTRKDNRIIRILPNTFPIEYMAEVIKVYPHATNLYTQGLEFDGNQLYEGTGSGGSVRHSVIAKVDLETGEIIQQKDLDNKYFGEGITILGDDLFQLTWQEYTCFVYDKNTLEEKKRFTYSGEGWGLCNNGELLIMSDGSEKLYFRDPTNFNVVKTLEIYDNVGPVRGINELEFINGKIFANVYTTNQIVIIDAETGVVTGRIDASLIALDYRKTGEVLNGIAYKESTKQLFITGKEWPNMLEIALVEE
ncbi:MAG: glutaminyl-peptide cyclotransferase [Brumimicrobium sp.]